MYVCIAEYLLAFGDPPPMGYTGNASVRFEDKNCSDKDSHLNIIPEIYSETRL